MTSMMPPIHKVKTKGSQKNTCATRFERSIKCESLYFEHVDAFQYIHGSCSTLKVSQVNQKCKHLIDDRRYPC